MGLERYRQKRNFRITPEPEGKVDKRKNASRKFVIQKHAARRLHYDFRLELDGVLLSWAVPKGPSLDPNDKRLAMHVEDHPIEYGDFEGVIPAKQYGAGTVMLWDRGTWIPKGDPKEAYEKGRLKFDFDGEKLHGGWNLVRSRSGKYTGDSWLLFKEADEYARLGEAASIPDDMPDSVATGRSLEEIAAERRSRLAFQQVGRGERQGGRCSEAETGDRRRQDQRERAKRRCPNLVEAELATLVKDAARRRELDPRDQVRRLPDAVPHCRRLGADDLAQPKGLDCELPDDCARRSPPAGEGARGSTAKWWRSTRRGAAASRRCRTRCRLLLPPTSPISCSIFSISTASTCAASS